MKRVLITGAAGFIGANLARRLVNLGHIVHLLVRPGSSLWRLEEIRAGTSLHEVDLCDVGALTTVVARVRPQWIFHLAAHGAYSWQTEARAIMETNVRGTVNLVQACLETGFESFVNTGSSSEYGWKSTAPPETCSLEPNSYYAVSKAAATLFCQFTGRSLRRNMPTLRLYSVYGPYEEPNRLMPVLVLQGLNGNYPPLTSPETARDFIYVDDVIDAYLHAATRTGADHGAVYNVGTAVQTRLSNLVAIAQKVFALHGNPVWNSMPDRNWDTSVWVADNHKIQKELPWQPSHTLEAGLRHFARWFVERPGMRQFYTLALKRSAAA
jgi:nucleoside-diphosphate-sugar epimerase